MGARVLSIKDNIIKGKSFLVNPDLPVAMRLTQDALIVKGELIEHYAIYAEDSESDFNSGTLTDVTATSAGDLELARVPGALNLLTANQSSVETDTTGLLRYDSYATVSRDTTEHWHGVASLKVVTTNPGSGFYFTRSVQKAGTYTFSVYIKLTQSTDVNITINGTNVVSAYDNFSLQAGIWTRISSTFTTTAATTVYIYVRCSIATTFFADGLQLEERPQASPWTLGGTVSPDTYATSGTREKIVDLSGANPAGGTKIEWAKTTPASTAVKVETALSTDGGSTYGAYAEATSGSSIPGIASDTDLSNAKLKIKETLSTTDTSITPQLHSLELFYLPQQVRLKGNNLYGALDNTLEA